jgi:3-phosphoshikimate 1-carboxyvinyltransferase
MIGEVTVRTAFTPEFVPNVPGSRSIAARALICASLAKGNNTVFNAPACDDTDAITSCVRHLAADVSVEGKRTLLHGWSELAPIEVLDCNASGTTMRFIAALSILTDKQMRLTGTSRLLERPMAGLNEVLEAVGKTVVDRDGVRIISGTPSIPIELEVDASTSGQFVSGLMMALGVAGKETILRAKNPVSIPFITMTLDVMKSFGAHISMTKDGSDLVFTIAGDGYKQTEYFVEPDIMSASYFFAAAAITGHPVFVPGLSTSTIQGDIAFVHALKEMGAEVSFIDGGIRVCRNEHAQLAGSTFDLHEMPDMSLTLAVLGALANGKTTMTSSRILQFKESDRSQVIVKELSKVGAGVEVSPDKDIITIAPATQVAAAAIDTYEDHRVAMAFGLLTLINPGVTINDPECVSKTWPEYFSELARFKGSM